MPAPRPAQNVRHVELFFDPQTHTDRGIAFETVIDCIDKAIVDARDELATTTIILMYFLRHLSEQEVVEASLPFRDRIISVGLDSTETKNPPTEFRQACTFFRKPMQYLAIECCSRCGMVQKNTNCNGPDSGPLE